MAIPIVLSGVQPSGALTLGNYLGALLPWKVLQATTQAFFCIVNLHSITIAQDPTLLKQNTLDALALYLACGINPQKSVIFLQSDVAEHTQLAWILNCVTSCGALGRMVQFKEKSARYEQNINAGLFTYPVLMAADILLYQANLVPVGEDQKQHLELCRDIAIRFNGLYDQPTFTVPDPWIPAMGGRIMGLADPTKKMSKSDINQNNCIGLLDPIDAVVKKISRAVTDGDIPPMITYNPVDKPGVSNLMSLLSSLSGASIDSIESEYAGQNYGALKRAVTALTVERLQQIQTDFRSFRADSANLKFILQQGALRAREHAQKTLKKVFDVIGFLDSFSSVS